MTTPVKGCYGTMYYVADMKKSVAYYKDTLGLKPRYESEEWTEFDLGDGTALCLHPVNGKKHHTGGTLIMNVQDIRGTVAAMKKKGAEFEGEVKEVHPGAFAAEFKDPAGNVISLYEATH